MDSPGKRKSPLKSAQRNLLQRREISAFVLAGAIQQIGLHLYWQIASSVLSLVQII